MARTKQTNRVGAREVHEALKRLDRARATSALWTKPTFKHCQLFQRMLQTEHDMVLLVGAGESRPRIETYSWFLQAISPGLFKDLIARNFRPPREGGPLFELDLTQAAVALPDGVSEMLGTAIGFYLRVCNDKQILEPLRKPESLEDFERRFVPNALKLMACGEFLGMGETPPPQEQGKGSAQQGCGGDNTVGEEDDSSDYSDEDLYSAQGGGSSDTLELARHVQYAVLKALKNAQKWMPLSDADFDNVGGTSMFRAEKLEGFSYFKAALALLCACQASPQRLDAMAKLEDEVMLELDIMIGTLVHPCLALGKLLGNDCSQEPWKALADTTVKRLVTSRHKDDIPELAKQLSTATELASAVELLVAAEKPEEVKDIDCLITKALLEYASSHMEELKHLFSARSPSTNEYTVLKEHIDFAQLTTEDLVAYHETLDIIEPAKLAEAMRNRLQLLKGHVEFNKGSNGGISIHNPYKDTCEQMNTHEFQIPDSMLAEPYAACSEFICLSNCLWELRVSPSRVERDGSTMKLSVEIRPARPNVNSRANTTNSVKYPTSMRYTLVCAGTVVADERCVEVDAVPDKGLIGWIRLKSICKPEADLCGKTITLRFASPKASRKRSRDDRAV